MPSTGLDTAVGVSLVSIAGLAFTYYTLWVVILPFVEDDHPMHQFFLPRIYAVGIPLVAGFTVLAGLGAFITMVMMKKKTKTS
ncbi:dolichol phosphate-mannose biosynthesis regulatory protein-like [Lineus longissimus]|uniref:dolichol phosphate-mannose biosynthesis regulatory protein-like n=1 Tax=Lineus longissimus TaxID=88925 RepID=UPI00315CDAC9